MPFPSLLLSLYHFLISVSLFPPFFPYLQPALLSYSREGFFAIKRFLLSPCFSLTKISFNIYLNRAHADDLITESRCCVCLRLDNRHAGGSEHPHKDLDWHDYFLLLCVEYIDFIFVLNKGCLSVCSTTLCPPQGPKGAGFELFDDRWGWARGVKKGEEEKK